MSKLIIVDVQPSYKNWIKFNINDFTNFIDKYDLILYLYNGDESGLTNDNPDSIRDWLVFEYDYEKIYDKHIMFYDKGYGFFRDWMDAGIDDDLIIKVIQHMLKVKKYDARDLDQEELDQLKIMKSINDIESQCLFVPDVKDQLLKFGNADICGGRNK